MRTCVRCGQTEPLDAFTFNERTPWYHLECEACRATGSMAAKHEGSNEVVLLVSEIPILRPRPSTRTCPDCGQTKPIASFPPRDRLCRDGDGN